MKRYINASSNQMDSMLVTAICNVIKSCLDMGDYLSDVVEGLADMGNIELPEDYTDENKMLKSVVSKLVRQRSSVIPDWIIYNFTEYSDVLLDEISTHRPSGLQSPLYKDIDLIYNLMDQFPNGSNVKSAIEENIFDSILLLGNAAEIGYAIGHEYWKYIKSEEYGVRSNTASAVGVSAGCSEAVGGKYMYAFAEDISSYYYKDTYMSYKGMPSFTGYMLKFYNEGDSVCADIFNLYVVPSSVEGVTTWDIGDKILDTFTFTEFDDSGITEAAKEVAAWYDSHVSDAINSAVEYTKTHNL